MVPGRSRWSKHVPGSPHSAPRSPTDPDAQKKQLARGGGGSPHARNGHPIDSEACAVAQEALFSSRRSSYKLAPLPHAAAFSTHSSFGAAMPRKRGALPCGSLEMRTNAIGARQACNERAVRSHPGY